MRIVVKVGTHAIANKAGKPDHAALKRLVAQLSALRKSGHEVFFVSSGAVAAGIEALGLKARPADVNDVQMCAAVGQARFICEYERLFGGHGVKIGQVLLTHFDFDMAAKIEPSLPDGPVFLMDYPKEAASLARLRGDVAERWELYFGGVELANCFTELCDGAEQRRRFLAAKDERSRLGESDYPIDGEFLDLLPLVGSASGVALGVDRLVALALGETDIHAVMCGE